MLTSSVSVAFADASEYEGAFGVITNADGEVIEVIPMPRQTYYDKRITLTPGDTLTTYQYEPNANFFAGFSFTNRNNETTTENARVLIELFGSSTIGADGKQRVDYHTFSTNIDDNKGSDYFSDSGVSKVALVAFPTNSMRYFNAKYTNKSSFTINLNVLVGMN